MASATSFAQKPLEPFSVQNTLTENSNSYVITIPKKALYAAGAVGSLYFVGFSNICVGLLGAYLGNKIMDAKAENTVLKGGAGIAISGALLGPAGIVIGTVAYGAFLGNRQEVSRMVAEAKAVLKETTPEIKKIGHAIMENARITIQETEPKGERI